MTRPGNGDIQMDLIFDYQNNVKLYLSYEEVVSMLGLGPMVVCASMSRHGHRDIPRGANNSSKPKIMLKLVDDFG